MPTYTIAGKKITSAEPLTNEELESLYDELAGPAAPKAATPSAPVEPFRRGTQGPRRYPGQGEADRKRRELEQANKPFTERRVMMRPDEYGERFGAEPETGPSLEKVKEAGTSTVMGLAGGIPRMVAGVSGLFGDTELSRLARKLESGIREKAPSKQAYDVAKYVPEVIPAAATAQAVSKIPIASRSVKQAAQAAGQAATAAAVEPEDRAAAAATAGTVGLIPLGVRGVGLLKEKFNEVMTGGKPDIVRDQLARIAEQLGFKIEAGQVSRTTPISTPGTEKTLESNQKLANRWASAPTGESTDKVTGTFLNERKNDLGKNYDEIFQKRQFNITGDSIREFEKILELEDSISPAHVPAVKKLAQQILKNYDEMAAQVQRTGTTAAADPTGRQAYSFTMDGEGLQRLRNKLRTAASTATDKTAGREIYNMIDNLDQIVKETDPKLYEKLMDTNQKYRATMTLKDLQDAKGIDAGDVSLERLGSLVRGDEYNPLFPIGNIGEQLGIRAAWEPAALGASRSATSQATSLIKPGMGRIIFNRLARYPSSQSARALQKKIIDAEATGGLGNLSLTAEEISMLNPILQSLREEPEEKAKGGPVYTPQEELLLKRYADGGPVKRPMLPADRYAGYKQVGESDDRLLWFFEAAARELPDAIKQNVTSNADLAAKYLKFKFGMMSPEEMITVARALPESLKGAAVAAMQAVKEAPKAVAEATPETAGKFAAQMIAGEMTDPLKLVRGMPKPTMAELDVYHGTPHRFPATEANPLGEFDASKIGTGEGAQAYGHGIYLAESPGVAESYKQMSPQMLPVSKYAPDEESAYYAARVVRQMGSPEKAIEKLAGSGKSQEFVKAIKDGSYKRFYDELPQASLYKADLPDEMIDRMLDWDKPIKDQPEAVREALLKLEPDADLLDKGSDVYSLVRSRMGGTHNQAAAQASQAFSQAGIPGIKYFDAGSRGQGGTGTRNFVVFPGEEKKVRILERK